MKKLIDKINIEKIAYGFYLIDSNCYINNISWSKKLLYRKIFK